MRKASLITTACDAKHAEEREALRQHRASSKRVAGYTCHAFPAAVLAGLGLWPVRILCDSSAEAESAGEKVVRADVCPLVKTLLGNVAEKRGLHGSVDLWIGLSTCDQMRRGMHSLSEHLACEVHPIQFPATRTPESRDYYASQVKRLVADIEARHGLRFDAGVAKKWQQDQDKAAAVLSKAARSGSVSPLDMHSMFQLYFISRPEGLADFFSRLIETSSVFKRTKTVVLTGGPLTREDTALLEELEERGYAVLPLNCTGLNAVEQVEHAPAGSDLIASLALTAFGMPTCTRSRPNTAVYTRIGETLKTTEAAGLIVKTLKFCDHWYTERERLRRSFGVPVLVFDSDYAEGGRERILSRIDAFLETLE
jgi:benzoyl-CoA reductase/2-hydroxyglutaryl-CoA dehydratase subunit BcrC/BadD/HgdB